jgi:parvulin-like peptidyl-prolyl isomerase
MNVRRPILLLAALGTASVLAACGGSSGGDSKTQADVPADSVALVDGKPILKKDFDHLVAIGLASFKARQQAAPKAGTQEYELLKQQAIQILFQRAIIKTEAAKQGVKVDQAKVAEELKNLKTQAGDDAAWQKQLKDAGATEADYTDTFAVQQLAQGLYDKLTKASAAVTDAEIQAQYDKDKATVYKVAASRKVEHILFGPKDGSTPAAKDLPKYKKAAEAVIKQLNEGGDFAKLVTKYSVDPGKTQNQGVYDVTADGFDPDFTKASYALKTGEVTQEPVKSQFGYHVIKAMADPTKDSTKTLAEVKAQIKSQLEEARKNKSVAAWFAGIQAQYEKKTSFATGYSLPPSTTAAATGTGATDTGAAETAPATTG